MANTIRCEWLFQAQAETLAALVEIPQQFDLERGRFDEPPPPYSGGPSLDFTRPQRRNQPGDEEQRRERREWDLRKEHKVSSPFYQFEAQTSELEEQTRERGEMGGGFHSKIVVDWARKIVKQCWVDQGI